MSLPCCEPFSGCPSQLEASRLINLLDPVWPGFQLPLCPVPSLGSVLPQTCQTPYHIWAFVPVAPSIRKALPSGLCMAHSLSFYSNVTSVRSSLITLVFQILLPALSFYGACHQHNINGLDLADSLSPLLECKCLLRTGVFDLCHWLLYHKCLKQHLARSRCIFSKYVNH